jgi:PHD/YefM family antitoxin component YafN of YafNO toxin-antitoxin module
MENEEIVEQVEEVEEVNEEPNEEEPQENEKVNRIVSRTPKRRTKIITDENGNRIRIPVKTRNISEETLKKLRSPENLERLRKMREKSQKSKIEKKTKLIKEGKPIRPPTQSQLAYIPNLTKNDIETIINSKFESIEPTLKKTVNNELNEYRKTKPKKEKEEPKTKFNFNDIDELDENKKEFIYQKIKLQRKEKKQDAQNDLLDQLADKFIM